MSSKYVDKVTTYCDADWVACPLTRKSVIGFLFKIGESLVSWNSKKLTTILNFLAKIEYRSLTTTIVELVWLLGLLKDLNISITQLAIAFSDSKAVV